MKILNVISGGMRREGITTTQYRYLKELKAHREYDDLQIDMVKIEGISSDETAGHFRKLGVGVFSFPNRRKHPIRYFCRLEKCLKRNRYDVLHVHGSSSIMVTELLAARLAGIPVRIAHSRNSACSHRTLHFILKPFFFMLYTDAFACGEEAGKWLFGHRDFHVIHNGIDFKRFCYSDRGRELSRRDLGLAGKAVFVHVGNFNGQKNHRFLLEVYREIIKFRPDSILYLIGDGPLKSRMMDYAQKLGIESNTIFAGSVEDVDRRLQAADVALFPSWHEGLPNVVLEWQAMGVPCLVSDRVTRECALTDLVTFMPLEAEAGAWARKAVSLLDRGAQRKENAKKAVAALQKAGFDIKENAVELAGLYRKCYGKH